MIAIENARLFEEVQARTEDLRESLQQQTATADVLKIISRSSVELETVLDTLVQTVARLCRVDQVHMYSRRDDKYHMLAACGLTHGAVVRDCVDQGQRFVDSRKYQIRAGQPAHLETIGRFREFDRY